MAEEKKSVGCMICGVELEYWQEPREMQCSFCRTVTKTTAACKSGHFVCDRCHAGEAVDLVEKLCVETPLKNPLKIAMNALLLPSVCMHGPEHHFLVPAVLLAAYHNTIGSPKEKKAEAVKLAKTRGMVIPGGWCGFAGCCGGAVGAGVFMSIVQGSTPLKTTEWQQSNEATGRCLSCLAAIGGPRCCKRTTFNSILIASRLCEKRLGVHLDLGGVFPKCAWFTKNAQCLSAKACPFHSAAAPELRMKYEASSLDF